MKKLAVFFIIVSSLFGSNKITAQVAVGISVGIAPPELPVYEQPPCPVEGYLWTPGYWYWGDDGYFWVPGVWLAPPTVGFLWTPGYWGFEGSHYWWHGGYWGPHVGFYGGVCYGYGYGGHGFYGGRWEGGRFRYNTAAWHVGSGFHNTYADRTVVVNNNNRTSFNGPRGVNAQPTAEERSAMNEHHVQATSAQMNHQHAASASRGQLATVNHGNPATAARSTVGGTRFNSGGHSISTAHTAHPVNNTPHTNAGGQQHNAQARPTAQPQHSQMQNRARGAQKQPHAAARQQPARGGQGHSEGRGHK